MSQDILSDGLNQIMNAKRAKKDKLVIERTSKLLFKILDIMKSYGYLEYDKLSGKIEISLKELNECRAVKPRYSVGAKKIDFYTRRFLPARNFGYLIISTSKGLMTNKDAEENKLGGCLVAYFY